MLRRISIQSNMSLRAVKSNPCLRRALHQSAPKPNPSSLLSTPSQYATMSLQSLKTECRSKGLKVSGKKSELMQRLSVFEATRSLSQSEAKMMHTSSVRQLQATPSAAAKGDQSTIDFFKFPKEKPVITEEKHHMFIPSPPDAYSKSGSAVEVKYKSPLPESAPTQIAGSSVQVSHNSGEKTTGPIVEALEGPTVPNQESELSGKDKGVLLGLFAAVSLWWALKPSEDSE